MRDILTIPFNDKESLIIACDNSGAIGMKEQDLVHVPYETVAYYSFRVAVMECIAAGGQPISVVLHNFCGNEPWDELVSGIQKGLLELNLKNVSITGSTESNFSLFQSAVGLVVIGKKAVDKSPELTYAKHLKFAVIGLPLLGSEVIEHREHVTPLSVFQELCRLDDVLIWPVGSKGILYEMNQMFPKEVFSKGMVVTNVDILKSSGPATCFIVVYHASQENEIKEKAAHFFHYVKVKTPTSN